MTTTPSEAHTPLPWQIGSPDDTLILGPNREEIAYMHGDYDFGDAYMAMEANCALIVTAVNERASLLSRIEQMRAALIEAQKAVKLLEDLTACGADDDYVEQVSRQISFALKAE